MPMPPMPMMITVSPGSTFAAFTDEPQPVPTPQPVRQRHLERDVVRDLDRRLDVDRRHLGEGPDAAHLADRRCRRRC